MDFTTYAKIIEGYFELLTLFPLFKNVKLENIEATEYSLGMVISETSGILTLTLPKDYNEPYSTETRKTIITISIFANTEIIKGDEIETKPE